MSQKEREKCIPHMWSLKCDTNEPIYEAEMQTQRTDSWLPRGMQLGEDRGGKLGLADLSFCKNGETAKSYRGVQRTIFNTLRQSRVSSFKPSSWATTIEPVLQSPGATATEPTCPATEAPRPRAHVPLQEKPLP